MLLEEVQVPLATGGLGTPGVGSAAEGGVMEGPRAENLHPV